VTNGREAFPSARIAEELRADILTGRRAAGERLPSETELAEQYGTSRPTVRRALARLRSEGLVVTSQGRVALVRPAPHVRLVITGGNYRKHRALGLPGFNAQVLEQGQAPEQQLREVATIAAPTEVAARLGLEQGSPVVVRRRVFLADGEPVALCDSYYPAGLAQGTPIEQDRKIRGGVHAVIEDPAGPVRRRIARSVDDLTSRMPTPQEAAELQLPQGVPVIRVLRTVFDTGDVPVEVQDTVAAGDRHEFRYEVSMDGDGGPGPR
jgi:GntR family transcriptional regulator